MVEGIFLDVREEVKVPEGSGPPGETETKLSGQAPPVGSFEEVLG